MISLTLTALALAALLLVPRLTGDETIGFGGVFEIEDGPGPTYVAVPKVYKLGIPNEVTGMVESKTLDLDEAVIRKLPTLKDGGTVQIQVALIAATWARVEPLRKARTVLRFRFTTPIDTGTISVQIPAFIQENKIEDLEAEKISVINMTLVVTGKQQ